MASPKRTGAWKAVGALAAVLLGLCVLANSGLGMFELVPDGAPLFGNLDEAVATLGLCWGLAVLFRRSEPAGG
jgi:hypothetical protein